MDEKHAKSEHRLTPRITGAAARSAEGTNMGHKNAEGIAHVDVRVEPTVRNQHYSTTVIELIASIVQTLPFLCN